MKSPALPLTVATLLAAFTLNIQPSAQADTFGTSGNEFTIDFVDIGNAGNAADTTFPFYGAVPYQYRVGTYEITQDAITKATASGMANVTAGAWTGNEPAANISWYEAAAFVNWLNTSKGYSPAYNLIFSNGAWSMSLWDSEQAWTTGGTNLYRHKDAYYFLPSDNEWYKAAHFNPGGSNYFLYPTASSGVPRAVASGTSAGTAVYDGADSVPARVDSAGGLSPYGTMGQGGNVSEWIESAFDGPNNSSSQNRTVRGGNWQSSGIGLRSSSRSSSTPTLEDRSTGFRIASVASAPTPSITIGGNTSATAFTTTYGTASADQSFTIAGTALTADISVTAVTGFEYSIDGGSTWGTTRTITRSGTTASATLRVRLAATAPVSGAYNGRNIALSSTGATSVNIVTAASGNAVSAKGLTIGGLTAQDKAWDGTTTATVTGTPTYVGLVNGESFAVSGSVAWAFADAAVGAGKSLTRTGDFAAPSTNYTVTQPSLTASITAAAAGTNAYLASLIPSSGSLSPIPGTSDPPTTATVSFTNLGFFSHKYIRVSPASFGNATMDSRPVLQPFNGPLPGASRATNFGTSTNFGGVVYALNSAIDGTATAVTTVIPGSSTPALGVAFTNRTLTNYPAGSQLPEASGAGLLSSDLLLPNGTIIPAGAQIYVDIGGYAIDYNDPASFWFDAAARITTQTYRGGTMDIFYSAPGAPPADGLPAGFRLLARYTNSTFATLYNYVANTSSITWSGIPSPVGGAILPAQPANLSAEAFGSGFFVLPAELAEAPLVGFGVNTFRQLTLDFSQGATTTEPGFAAGTRGYTATVPWATTNYRLTPVAAGPGATITINDTDIPSGEPSPGTPLAVGTNIFTIVVTAADGSRTREYRVEAIRASFSGAGEDFSGQDFAGQDLSHASAEGANFTGADLSGANLSGGDFSSADFSGATLTGADLEGTDLSAANLSGVVSGGITGTPFALPAGWRLVGGTLVSPEDSTPQNVAVLDFGGLAQTAGDRRNVGFTGTAGLVATADGGQRIARQGGVGMVFFPAGYDVSADSPVINEAGSTPESSTRTTLSARKIFDDGTFGPADATVVWNPDASKAITVSAEGAAQANTVYQDTLAAFSATINGSAATNFLTVRNTLPDNYEAWAGDTFDDAWEIAQGMTGAVNPTDLNNGVPAWQLYAMGINPALPFAGSLTVPGLGTNGYFSISYTRNPYATGYTFTPQETGNLTPGFTNMLAPVSSTNLVDGVEQITTLGSVPMSSTNRQFLRLQITRPQP